MLAPCCSTWVTVPARPHCSVKPGHVLTLLPDGAEALLARLGRLERRSRRAAGVASLADPLTEREVAVLRLLQGTLSLREIGQELHLSANTIKTHTQGDLPQAGRQHAAGRRREGPRAGLL